MRTDVDCVMWCLRILARGGANLASFGDVKALGLIATLAACNFQATRVDNPAIDASNPEQGADAAVAIDAAIDTPAPPPDTQFCLGAGLVRVCFATAPTGNLPLPLGGTLDTTASANCN